MCREPRGWGRGRNELLQDGKVLLKTNYAGWKLVMPNVSSSVYKSISVFYDHFLILKLLSGAGLYFIRININYEKNVICI